MPCHARVLCSALGAHMQDVLVAATPPVVTALLAVAGVWLRRRSSAQSGARAVEEARSRITVITTMLDIYRNDPARGREQQQLMKDLDEAYRHMYSAQQATIRQASGGGLAPVGRAVLLLDRRPTTATAKVAWALYYLSLAWVLLWLAAALMFGLGIAFLDTPDSFGLRLAMSFGITVLALAIGLAPAVALHLLARMLAEPSTVRPTPPAPVPTPGDGST